MSVFGTHVTLSTGGAGHGNFVTMRTHSEDEIEVSICASEKNPEWEDFVQHFPRATFCHAHHWRSIIHEAYGHHPIYLMAKCRGRVRGILPLFLVKSRIFGRSLASMPFLDYGGACADSPEATRMLLTQAMRLLQRVGADYLEIRQCDPLTENLAARLDKVSMILDLSPGIEGLWQSLPAKVRNQVRKADKAKLQVTFGGAELLEEFYPVFAVNMRDLGLARSSLGFFHRAAQATWPAGAVSYHTRWQPSRRRPHGFVLQRYRHSPLGLLAPRVLSKMPYQSSLLGNGQVRQRAWLHPLCALSGRKA
jgi:hypothetical protein